MAAQLSIAGTEASDTKCRIASSPRPCCQESGASSRPCLVLPEAFHELPIPQWLPSPASLQEDSEERLLLTFTGLLVCARNSVDSYVSTCG